MSLRISQRFNAFDSFVCFVNHSRVFLFFYHEILAASACLPLTCIDSTDLHSKQQNCYCYNPGFSNSAAIQDQIHY